MPPHPEERKTPTTPSPASERSSARPRPPSAGAGDPAASRLPPVPARPEPERSAQQLLNSFLVHHALTRSHQSGSAEEVSADQMRVWSETYTAQRQHLIDLIAAGLRSGEVLF